MRTADLIHQHEVVGAYGGMAKPFDYLVDIVGSAPPSAKDCDVLCRACVWHDQLQRAIKRLICICPPLVRHMVVVWCRPSSGLALKHQAVILWV